MELELKLLPDRLTVCHLDRAAPIPPWATSSELWFVSRTADELSVVCPEELVPPGIRSEGPWRAFVVASPLDFGLTGVLVALARPLAAVEISIFAISTYNTDYVLVRQVRLGLAIEALRGAGHTVTEQISGSTPALEARS